MCLGGSIGGDMFTLYDVTGGTKQAIPKGVYVYVQFWIVVLAIIVTWRTIQLHPVKMKRKLLCIQNSAFYNYINKWFDLSIHTV